jgi:hypothetical protein
MKKKIDYAKIGKLCAKGLTLTDAMEAGGFSKASAKRGMSSMNEDGELIFKSARDKAAMKKLGKFALIGKEVNAEQQENLVRGALLANVANGEDKASQSLKMLGTDRRVNMFTPESASGVIVIQAARIPSFEKLACGCYEPCNCRRAELPQSVEAR